jgi:hypothetical protein
MTLVTAAPCSGKENSVQQQIWSLNQRSVGQHRLSFESKLKPVWRPRRVLFLTAKFQLLSGHLPNLYLGAFAQA